MFEGFGSRGSHTSGDPQHLAVCTFAERAVAGAAVRRRQRFLRSMWRHEQLSLKMMAASMSHFSRQSRESVVFKLTQCQLLLTNMLLLLPRLVPRPLLLFQ